MSKKLRKAKEFDKYVPRTPVDKAKSHIPAKFRHGK